mmetsp:Transcript_3691/g.8145  ORF Transcript_3691/g.8145 Transcript_3691/m.8145 type:complete len:271 (-) Transcript_3691:298-1110(-)
MDESFSSTTGGATTTSKFPTGEPSDEWTIEQLLHWSLDQYQMRTIEQTSNHIASLRNQCEKECEDVMTLHSLAVEMASKNKGGLNNNGNGIEGGLGGGNDENVNPQSNRAASAASEIVKPSSTTSATNNNAANAASSTSSTTNTTAQPPSTNSDPLTITIQMTIGPHAPTSYVLRPRPGQPCFLGRSKGKKFTKNGISLHKDQEVSTTHGKFFVELTGDEEENRCKFYFVDVGSTNGTVYEGEQLEPNERLGLVNGTELKVGNSVLKVVL